MTVPGPLRELLGRRPPEVKPGERCELCGVAIAAEHSHVVNVQTRQLRCTCRPCALLFLPDGASEGRYRTVGDRYLHDPGLRLPAAAWDRLQIPVGTAFAFYNSALERAVAFYPSPAGATESLLDADVWQAVGEVNPALTDLEPDVEALLLHQQDDGVECYVVPIDACYELVGIVRLHWRGFDGGQEAREAIRAFFQRLRDRARPLETRR